MLSIDLSNDKSISYYGDHILDIPDNVIIFIALQKGGYAKTLIVKSDD